MRTISVAWPARQRNVPCVRSGSRRPANDTPHSAHTAVNVVADPSICTTLALTSRPPSLCRCEVRELCVALEERELHRIRRAVAVLREDHLGEPLMLRLLV